MRYFLLCFVISIYAMEHDPPHPFLMTIAQSRFSNLLSPEMQKHTTEASFKEKALRTFLSCLSSKKKALFEEVLRGRTDISFPDGPTVSRTFEDPILYVSLEQTLYEALEKGEHTYWIETESGNQNKHLFKLSAILSWIKQGKFIDPFNRQEIIAAKIWEIKNSPSVTRREDLENQFMSPNRFKYKFFQSQLEPSPQRKTPRIRQRLTDPMMSMALAGDRRRKQREARLQQELHFSLFDSPFDQPDVSYSRWSTTRNPRTGFQPPYSPLDPRYLHPPTFSRYSR
jgi:hypothetical protein